MKSNKNHLCNKMLTQRQFVKRNNNFFFSFTSSDFITCLWCELPVHLLQNTPTISVAHEVLTRENEGQRGRAGSLAGICEFHKSYF